MPTPKKMTSDPSKISVEAARHAIHEHALNGVICPCCDRLFKAYKRNVGGDISKVVLWMYRYALREGAVRPWIKVMDLAPHAITKSRDYAKGQKWGLLEPRGDKPDGKKSSGYWRLTPKGEAYVRGEIRVDSHKVFLVNDAVDLSPEQKEGLGIQPVTIKECFEETFDYDELMA